MQWTNDVVPGVAAPAQHHRLAVAADVRDQLDATRRAHQRPPLPFLRQGVKVAYFGHGQFVRQVARSVLEDEFLLALEQSLIEVGEDRELRARALQSFQRSAQVRHDPQDLQKTCLMTPHPVAPRVGLMTVMRLSKGGQAGAGF